MLNFLKSIFKRLSLKYFLSAIIVYLSIIPFTQGYSFLDKMFIFLGVNFIAGQLIEYALKRIFISRFYRLIQIFIINRLIRLASFIIREYYCKDDSPECICLSESHHYLTSALINIIAVKRIVKLKR